MNSLVHRQLVADAQKFMWYGTPEEQLAIARLQALAGGPDQLRQILMAGADQVDGYSDLQFVVPCIHTDYACYDGRWTTGLNHYLNAFLVPYDWEIACGYHYPWSSQTTYDADFNDWRLDALDVHIEGDPSLSLILDRIQPYWLGAHRTWENNWTARLPFSEFPPCSAVAATYYNHLINHYNDPMHVNIYGQYPHLQGLEKLGPVLHFFGDVIVPQHVRAAHGFLHLEWENLAESLVFGGTVGFDPQQVRNLLASDAFSGWLWQGGLLNGLYAVDYVVVAVADMTREKIQTATGTDIDTLWGANDTFWLSFLLQQKENATAANWSSADNCMQWFYNLGVAGCVHTLRRASEDLVSRGIAPQYAAMQPIPTGPMGSIEQNQPTSTSISEAMEQMMGFAPSAQTPIWDHLRTFEQLFAVDRVDAINTGRLSESLASVQESLEHEFVLQGDRHLRSANRVKSRSKSGFGFYAYKPPTADDLAGELQFRRYIEASRKHTEMVHLLSATATVATVGAMARRGTPPDRINEMRRSLERSRDEAVRTMGSQRRERVPVPDGTRLIGREGRPLPRDIRRVI